MELWKAPTDEINNLMVLFSCNYLYNWKTYES